MLRSGPSNSCHLPRRSWPAIYRNVYEEIGQCWYFVVITAGGSVDKVFFWHLLLLNCRTNVLFVVCIILLEWQRQSVVTLIMWKVKLIYKFVRPLGHCRWYVSREFTNIMILYRHFAKLTWNRWHLVVIMLYLIVCCPSWQGHCQVFLCPNAIWGFIILCTAYDGISVPWLLLEWCMYTRSY